MNWSAAIQLALAVAQKQNPLTTLADLEALYNASQVVKAQGPKAAFAQMVKDGTLQPDADALARSSALLDAVLKDKTLGPIAIGLLESL